MLTVELELEATSDMRLSVRNFRRKNRLPRGNIHRVVRCHTPYRCNVLYSLPALLPLFILQQLTVQYYQLLQLELSV